MINLITNDLIRLEENDLKEKILPKNIYAILIEDFEKKEHLIATIHNGYCPILSTEREQSNYNDYLSNLENSIVIEYFKNQRVKKKEYRLIKELVTDSTGNLYHYL